MQWHDNTAPDDADARRSRIDRYDLFPALSRKTSIEVGKRARVGMLSAQAGKADNETLDVLKVCGWVLTQREWTP